MTSERRTYLKIFTVMVLGMAAAMGLVRLTTWLNDAGGSQFLGRVIEAREALPRVLREEGDLVMFFGSSMTEAGFSARYFDRVVNAQGGNVKSWNLGFGGLNPYFQDFLSRRIRETCESEGQRFRLVLIEFNPFQATRTRWQRAEATKDSYLSLLASDRELLEIALDDPERGTLLFNIKYFRDNVSAEVITTFFTGGFDDPPQNSDRPGLDEAAQARLDELSTELSARFETEYPDWDGSEWNYAWQGAGTVPWERPADTVAMIAEYYGYFRNEQSMHNDLLHRVATADILDLEFEELLIEHFIAMIANFRAIADEVEVVLLPRNTEWVQYTPEVEARLNSVIERIQREAGVPVRNHQTLPEITPDMFVDSTHLGRYIGDIPYTEFLAGQYAERLARP